MSSEPTLKSLQQQIDQLTNLVEKQNKIILSTGEKLMQIQLQQQKDKHNSLESNSNGVETNDSEFVKNEDIVQLVGELQGQLLTLDYKSFSRVANSKRSTEQTLEIIPNHDGEFPSENIYPSNKKEFYEYDDLKIYILAKFYELIPESKNIDADDVFIKYFTDLTVEDSEKILLKSEMKLLLPEKADRDELFNKLAVYLGVEEKII
ncbi:hypothetical protein QEN19_001302 [Hanseniaspora menglaensis]